MLDPHEIPKVAETGGLGSFTWIHLIVAMVIAGLTGGFFNPVLKIIIGWWKKIRKSKSDAIAVATIQKEEKTEEKLWERVESLETKLQIEVDKRIISEKKQSELQSKVDALEIERLSTLTRYIHLKLRVEEAKNEIEYLKTKLREKDPEFDKDYPIFSVESDVLADEKLVEEIVISQKRSIRAKES